MTETQRAARRFSGLSVRDDSPRPCERCGAIFSPPALHPGRVVCAACRKVIKHQRRNVKVAV